MPALFLVSALGCRELLKINKLGISYRVPPPGASIDVRWVYCLLIQNCRALQSLMDEGITWMKYSGPYEVGAGVSVSLQSESADGKTKSRFVVVDAVNVVGNGNESIPTTASEVVMTESTIPSTAVGQNETVSSDQHDFNDFMDSWFENTQLSGSTLAPHVADVLPTCRRHRQMSPNLGRHCVSFRHRRGPDMPNLCQLQPTSTSQSKHTS